MTTEPSSSENFGPVGPKRVGRLPGWLSAGGTLLLILAGWVGVMALLAAFTDTGDSNLVIGPERQMLNAMPSGSRLVRGGRFTQVIASSRPGHVGDLYRAGAWLVLPALANGCLALRPPSGSGTPGKAV